MTRTVGCVEIDSHGLSAKCMKCRKTISYPVGTGYGSDRFKADLREFTAEHNSKHGTKGETHEDKTD